MPAMRGAPTPLANRRSATARKTTRTGCTPPLKSFRSSFRFFRRDFHTQSGTTPIPSMDQNISV